MNRQEDQELAIRYVINAFLNDNDRLLESLEDLEHEGWLKKIECLLTQIDQDNSRGDLRSALRKTLVLRGLLKRKL